MLQLELSITYFNYVYVKETSTYDAQFPSAMSNLKHL
jgi:hypothetical protein